MVEERSAATASCPKSQLTRGVVGRQHTTVNDRSVVVGRRLLREKDAAKVKHSTQEGRCAAKVSFNPNQTTQDVADAYRTTRSVKCAVVARSSPHGTSVAVISLSTQQGRFVAVGSFKEDPTMQDAADVWLTTPNVKSAVVARLSHHATGAALGNHSTQEGRFAAVALFSLDPKTQGVADG